MKIIVAIVDLVVLFISFSLIAQGNVFGGIAFFVITCLVEAFLWVKFRQ